MIRTSLYVIKFSFQFLMLTVGWGTCSDYEVNRLELYNDFDSTFDFWLKTFISCSSYQSH